MRNITWIVQPLVGFFILSVFLMVWTVPLLFALPVSALAIYLLHRSRDRYAIAMVSLPLALLLLVTEILLRVLPSDYRPQYYRPHELLVDTGDAETLSNYLPNRRIENFKVPHGDLVALSFTSTIVDPHTVNFYTDSLGFRNERDYDGQRFVVFGDSFTMGSLTTQEEILSEALTRFFYIPTYNAGFPGGVDEYIARVKYLRRLHGDAFKAIVLVFEGNDFPCEDEEEEARIARQKSKRSAYVPGEIRHLQTYRLLYGLTRRAFYGMTSRDKARQDLLVLFEEIAGKDVGFLRHYVRATTRRQGCDWSHYRELFRSVSDRIALIVFVPTKFRVYYPFIGNNGGELPQNVQARFLESLAKDLSLNYLDVTPHLISASRAHLQRGEYTFWRDDSHWNGRGIAAAAGAIAEFLRGKGLVENVK